MKSISSSIVFNNIEFFDINEYENRYAISKCGLIYSYHTENIKLQQINKDGYPTISLHKDGNRTSRLLIHRLMASTFLNNDNNLEFVNHIDNCKTNNGIENLEWCSRHYNASHAIKFRNVKTNDTRNSISEDNKRLAIELFNNGTSKKEIALLVCGSKKSHSTITRLINNYNMHGELALKFSRPSRIKKLL